MNLTVIIPTWNSGKYLKECLDSIANQTLKPVCTIIVDNNSEDNTKDIIKEFSETKMTTLEVNIKPRCNIGYSRNVGLITALKSGLDLVVMVDSDDTIESDYIQNMWDIYNENTCTWVSSSYKRSDGIFVDLQDNFTLEMQKEMNRLSAFIMANPKDLMVVGGYSPLAIAEDWELWYRLLMMEAKVRINHKGGYNYRIHGESSSAKKTNIESNTRELLNVMKREW